MASQKNLTFLQKYNKLDQLCRQKFNMFRDANGEHENKSAIREYAYTLSPIFREKLLNLIKLRNIIAHTSAAEASTEAIKDLDTFIEMIKSGKKINDPDEFEAKSYIRNAEKRIKQEIDDLIDDIEDEDGAYKLKAVIKNELGKYLTKIKKAKSIPEAKRIMKDFHEELEDFEDNPTFRKEAISILKERALFEINQSYNEFLDAGPKFFAKRKAKDAYARYSASIERATNEEDIDDLEEQFENFLNDLEEDD